MSLNLKLYLEEIFLVVLKRDRFNMAGHHKFSHLTQDLSAARIAKIAEKVAQLKEEMAIHELSQALKISQPSAFESR